MSRPADFNKELEKYIDRRKINDMPLKKGKNRWEEPDIDEETKRAIEDYSTEEKVKVIEGEDSSVWAKIVGFFSSVFGSKNEYEEDVLDEQSPCEDYDESDKEVEGIIQQDEEIEEQYRPKKGFFARIFGRTKWQESELEQDIEQLRRDCDEYLEDIDMLSSELKRTFKVTNSIITSLSDRYIEKIKKSEEFKEYKQIISRFNAYKRNKNKKEQEE
ncbi:MAG TPA: hypothetical protein PLX15_04140 [Candidatus Woesearchaeota archaeon]|nr:hypothetical protein [Candidatus Woesearchaeota archaeon]